MPALPSSVIDPLFSQFETLLPAPVEDHPLGCHRPRVPDHVVFDKLIARLILGGAYTKHADDTVAADSNQVAVVIFPNSENGGNLHLKFATDDDEQGGELIVETVDVPLSQN